MRNLNAVFVLKSVALGLLLWQAPAVAQRAALDAEVDRMPDLSVPENTYGVYRDQYGAYRDSSMLPDNMQVPIIDQRRYSYKHNVAPKPNADVASGSSSSGGMGGGMMGGMGGGMMGGMGGGSSSGGGMSGGGMMGGMGGGMSGGSSGGMMGGGMSGGMGGGMMGGGGPGGPPGSSSRNSSDGRFTETGVVFGLFDTKGLPQSVAIVGPNNGMTSLNNPTPPSGAAQPAAPSDPAYHGMERQVMPRRARQEMYAPRPDDYDDDDDGDVTPERGMYRRYPMQPMRSVSARTFNPLAHIMSMQPQAAPHEPQPVRPPRRQPPASPRTYRPVLTVSATRLPAHSTGSVPPPPPMEMDPAQPSRRRGPSWMTAPKTAGSPAWMQM